jgi:hypothetical protein
LAAKRELHDMQISTNKWMVLVFVAGLAITAAVWFFTGHFVFVLLLFPPLFLSFGNRRPRDGSPPAD